MSRSKSNAILLLSILALALLVTPAYSTSITTYSDSAIWQAAVSGVQTDNFEGLAPGGSFTFYNGGIFQNSVEFIGISGQTGVGDTSSGFFSSFANFGTGEAGFVSGSTSVHITLPTAVTAFGISLFTSPTAQTYTVTTLSTPFTVPTFTTPTPAFFGVTSDTAFSTVDLQLSPGYNYGFFDNFQWGTAQISDPVPEAGTFLLIGSGLIGIAVFRKRKPRGSDAR